MNHKKIFLLEDDPIIQRLIVQILEKEGYKVRACKTIASAAVEVVKFVPDLLILDRRLPDGDSIELCRLLKGARDVMPSPVMFLTSKNSTSDKVLGLKMGADDYLTKPFEVDELLARVEVLLRRNAAPVPLGGAAPLVLGGIRLEVDKHLCTVDGKEIVLWPKEFELLKLFISRPDKVISKDFLSQHVWGHDFIDTSRAIEMSVRRLRSKLGRKHGSLLKTVKGYGFKLASPGK